MRNITRIPVSLDGLLKINVTSLSNAIFHVAVILSFFGSLYPWPFWHVDWLIQYVVCLLLLLSEAIRFYFLKQYRKPILLYIQIGALMFQSYLSLSRTQDGALGTLVLTLLRVVTYYCIFSRDSGTVKKSLVLTSKIMAVLLSVSMIAFLYNIFVASLPSASASYQAYDFLNYRYFLVAEGSMWTFFPRFQSIFLEPSHMGIACVFLLMTDVGRWRKWYNIVLILATLISFSAEAYVLLVALTFLGKWIMRKNFIRNMVILVVSFMGIVVGSFFYNNGDNLLNTLIVSRFEVEDGEVAGNNRTTKSFDAEYESFLASSDLLFGRGELSSDFGNAGYKVYIYRTGLIGTFFLFLFYASFLYNPKSPRPAFTAFFLSTIHFVIRAHMLWSSCVIPMYYMAQMYRYDGKLLTDDHCKSEP